MINVIESTNEERFKFESNTSASIDKKTFGLNFFDRINYYEIVGRLRGLVQTLNHFPCHVDINIDIESNVISVAEVEICASPANSQVRQVINEMEKIIQELRIFSENRSKIVLKVKQSFTIC